VKSKSEERVISAKYDERLDAHDAHQEDFRWTYRSDMGHLTITHAPDYRAAQESVPRDRNDLPDSHALFRSLVAT
jgi:hypothetical protein